MEQLSLVIKKFLSFTLFFVVSFSLIGQSANAAFFIDKNGKVQQTDPTLNSNTGKTDSNTTNNNSQNSNQNDFQSQDFNIQTGVDASGNDAFTQQLLNSQTQQQQQQQAESVIRNLENGTQGTQGNAAVNGNAQGQNQSLSLSEIGAVEGLGGCFSSIVGSAVQQAMVGVSKRLSSERFTEVTVRTTQDVVEGGSEIGTPSLNAIGYCIINAVIDMLTQATLEWIQSGFDGNPAFVSNPEQFFKDIADTTTAGLLRDIVGGTTGVDICSPFKLQIVTGLAGSRGDDYATQSRCTLNDIGDAIGESGVEFDYDAYTSGNSKHSGSLNAWWGVTQHDKNNPYGSYFLAQKELQKRLTVKQNTAQLDLTMGRGFLSFEQCFPSSTTTDQNGKQIEVRKPCKTSTPGSVIEEQLNNRLSSGNNRLVMADKFDQVITALVEQLIKTALSEVLTTNE